MAPHRLIRVISPGEHETPSYVSGERTWAGPWAVPGGCVSGGCAAPDYAKRYHWHIHMSKFFIGAEELGRVQVGFAEFVQLVSGRSIVSAADWGGGRVELGDRKSTRLN